MGRLVLVLVVMFAGSSLWLHDSRVGTSQSVHVIQQEARSSRSAWEYRQATSEFPSANIACPFVELLPGYPGFKGFVTGVDGVGDYACLTDLKAVSGFSRGRTDAAHLQAAHDLGIDGDLEDFTWENWTAIEAQQGLPATCFLCALFSSDSRQEPAPRDMTDARLLIGDIDSDAMIYRLKEQYGVGQSLLNHGYTDYDLRILATLTSNSYYPNAPELVDLIDYVFSALTGANGNQDYLDPLSYWYAIIDRGGWFLLPQSASPEEQLANFQVAVYATRNMWSTDTFNNLTKFLDQRLPEWEMDFRSGATSLDLRSWLRSNEADGWI